jgi:bacterioferritin (cytochrome b1)
MSNAQKLPRPAEELEALADYYDEHDTADEMETGKWVEPMVTTSLRLPREVFEQLKENARREGKRHTAYIRDILERQVHDSAGDAGDLQQINHKLDALLEAVTTPRKATSRTTTKKTSTRKRAATPDKTKRSA